jgi:hypothetical protein
VGWDLEKLCAQGEEVQDAVEGNLSAIESDSGNVEMQWNSIKKCVLDIVSDLAGKVKRKARKSWITLEMISKLNSGGGRVSIVKKEGRIHKTGNKLKSPRKGQEGLA